MRCSRSADWPCRRDLSAARRDAKCAAHRRRRVVQPAEELIGSGAGLRENDDLRELVEDLAPLIGVDPRGPVETVDRVALDLADRLDDAGVEVVTSSTERVSVF